MASVVLTVVGTAIGGPVGGLIGGLVGRTVDQAIFGGTASRTIEGGRLKDLSVQTSAYGTPISRIYGTMRLPGNMVWSAGLKESRNEKTAGGGKGQQTVTTVTYSYSASFAMALSGREIADVGRIWADGKLLRDSSGAIATGGTLRIYTGSEFQNADPLIEAIEGQASANAFRALAYVVFDGLELGNYANRIPNLTFEVIADVGGTVLLSTIVADICQLSGLSACDASGLTRVVEGYMISGPVKSRSALEQLAAIYNFDVIEQDKNLLFRHLDRPADVAITPAELVKGAGKARERIILGRQQDMELPREVGMSYIDPARDYQTGYQRARRVTTASDVVHQSAVPLVLASAAAKTIAEIQLDLAWYGRKSASFTLPSKYADLLPGDILTLTINGNIQNFLLQEVETGAEGIHCRAVKFSRSILTRNSVADSGLVPPQQVTPLATSQLLPLDMPAITGDNITAPILFLAVAAGSGNWPGAGLFISRDNDLTYSQLDFSAVDVVSGVVENTLVGGPAAYWDEAGECYVRLDNPGHSLAGETAAAVLDGANVAWVGGEIIQFRQAVLQLDGRYLLSGLLRGRRGTERRISGHGPAEVFVLLTATTVSSAVMALSDIGQNRQFKAVTSGDNVANVLPLNYTFGAESLKPFSPVHAVGVRDSAGTLTLTWLRRSRVGGEWMDNVDVPLGELYEKYDIEILNGANVVRTLTSTAATVVYPATLQLSDFGSIPASLTLRISQISDSVGRGWPLTVAL
ncbi:MAG: hypothetical protein GXP02_08380 [Alphaproteobacteria bacterium]|nr:hypothetical protein [Alphaproteobacteria bacterium]